MTSLEAIGYILASWLACMVEVERSDSPDPSTHISAVLQERYPGAGYDCKYTTIPALAADFPHNTVPAPVLD